MPDFQLSRDAVRDVDRRAIEEFGLPGIVLMENAGRGAVEALLQQGCRGPVAICAGKGNNGGDGFVIARHLELRDLDVKVLLFCDSGELTGDAAINFRVIQAAGIPIIPMTAAEPDSLDAELSSAEWIVDALLGTGLRGAVREPYRTAIAAINRSGKRVLAIDLPSGMDCDTGEPLGACVNATCTVTFVALKAGFVQNPRSVQFTGPVCVVDIGVPRSLLESVGARAGRD